MSARYRGAQTGGFRLRLRKRLGISVAEMKVFAGVLVLLAMIAVSHSAEEAESREAKSVKVVRYQSEKVHATWQEYREHMDAIHCG